MASTILPSTACRASWSHLLRAAIDVSLRSEGLESTNAILASLSFAPTMEEYPHLAAKSTEATTATKDSSYNIRVGGRWADIADDSD